LGGRKGIQPVKTERLGAGVVICLERDADLHMAQLMPLPLTVSCFSKIQIGFYSRDAMLAQVLAMAVCLSQVSVLSKRFQLAFGLETNFHLSYTVLKREFRYFQK